MEIEIQRKGGPQGSPFLFVPGALLTTMGILIFWKPDLLAYLVAGLLLMMGAILLGAAWQMRRGRFAGRSFGTVFDRMGPGRS